MKLSEKIQHYGLEFITVFLGVTLSLLAESWRQDRSDLAAQHDSLVQMYSDLRLEENDMTQNMDRAKRGLQAARFLIAGVGGHDADSVSEALTALGDCSFFVPYQSEYTALKSSGRLTVIEEPALRQEIVRFYEVDPFIEWLHERDCTLTGELMDSMLGKFEFVERAPRDSLRNGRVGTSAGAGAPATPRPTGFPQSAADSSRPRRRDFQVGSRYPRVQYNPSEEAALNDRALRDRIVRLATQRSYLIGQLQSRIGVGTRDNPDGVGGTKALRDSIRIRLGSDTSAIHQTPRPARRRPLGGTRNP